HDPRPPDDWKLARKNWCRFVRGVLEMSLDLDSERQVRNACIDGVLPADAWEAWDAIRLDYDPNAHRKPMWFSDHALKACEAWAKKDNHGRGGIVWTEHYEFARKLSERTGWRYFGEGGFD